MAARKVQGAAHLAVVAKASDQVTGPLKSASKAMVDAAATAEKADKRIAGASDAVAAAYARRLPANKRVEIALAREAAAGDKTATHLVNLREKHALVTAEMQRLARAGAELPATLIAEARAIDKQTKALEAQAKARAAQGAGATPVAAGFALNPSILLADLRAITAPIRVVGETLFGLAKSASQSGDAFFVLSDKLGVSTESLSRLAFGAKQNGATFEQFRTALQALGNRAARTPKEFEKIGVSVRDASNQIKAVDVLFRDVAEAISRLPPGAARVSAAQALMEEGGRALVPVLQQGAAGIDALSARADELGVTLSSRAAVQANAFGNELAALEDVTTAFARTVGLAVIPTITRGFTTAQNVVGIFVSSFGQSQEDMQRSAMRGASGVVGSIATILEAYDRLNAQIDGGSKILDRLGNAFDRLDEKTGGQLSTQLGNVADALTFGGASLLRNAASGVDSMGDALEEYGREGAKAETTTARVAREIRKLQADLARGDIGGTAATAATKQAQAMDTLAAATRRASAAQSELADAHVRAYQEAFDDSDFAEATAAAVRADEERSRRMADVERQARESRSRAAEAEAQRAIQREQRVASAIESTLTGAYEAAKAGPKAFADFALKELERLAVSTVFRIVAQSLASIFTGGIGGGLLGLLGFADGGIVPQRFAAGGMVSGGVPNKDSVPALLMPGELVVPKGVAQSLPENVVDALLGRRPLTRFAAGGMVGGGGTSTIAPAPVYVSMSVQTPAPPSAAAVERMVRDSLPRALASLNSAGFRLPGTQRVRR